MVRTRGLVSAIMRRIHAPYNVPRLYRYNTLQQWGEWHQRHHLIVDRELPAMRLYPPIVNLLFGGRLQYLAVLRAERG